MRLKLEDISQDEIIDQILFLVDGLGLEFQFDALKWLALQKKIWH